MKAKTSVLCGLLWLSGSSLLAQQPPADPIGENFVPPELVLQQQHALGLNDEQKNFVQAEVQKAHERLPELQRQLEKERDALAALLKKERAEEVPVLAQLDKLLDVERRIRRQQLTLLLRIKNKLTAEQQAQLKAFRDQLPAIQAKLEAKLHQVQTGVESLQQDGRDPSPIAQIMQEFDPLMKAGQLKEAEAVLDRALKRIEGKEIK